jgi:hypothetical protein
MERCKSRLHQQKSYCSSQSQSHRQHRATSGLEGGATQSRRYEQQNSDWDLQTEWVIELDSLPLSQRIEPERDGAKFRSNHGPHGFGGSRCRRRQQKSSRNRGEVGLTGAGTATGPDGRASARGEAAGEFGPPEVVAGWRGEEGSRERDREEGSKFRPSGGQRAPAYAFEAWKRKLGSACSQLTWHVSLCIRTAVRLAAPSGPMGGSSARSLRPGPAAPPARGKSSRESGRARSRSPPFPAAPSGSCRAGW